MTGDGQGRKQRGSRRQHRIDDLLSACRAEVVKLERGAARDLAASERLAQLLRGGDAWGSSEPGTPGEDLDEEPLLLSEDEEGGKADLDSEDALFAPDPLHLQSQEARLQGQRHSAEIAKQLLEALASDNTVMECNVRDYEVALSCTIDEIVRTRAEVVQMESVCGQMGQLQELLAREGDVHARLHEENAQLVERQHELLAVIQEAIEADDDEEDVALARGLRAENAALRKLLFSTGYTELEIEFEPPPREPLSSIKSGEPPPDHHPTQQLAPPSSTEPGDPLPCLATAAADRPQELSRGEPRPHQGGPFDFHAALQEGLRKESLRRGEDACEEREEGERRAHEPCEEAGHQEAQDTVPEEEPPAIPAARLDDAPETREALDLPAVVFTDS